MTNRSRDAGFRRAPRMATRLPGTLSGRTSFPVVVLDLSLRGCLARCEGRLDRGLIMDLELTIEEESLTAKVRVAESSRDGEASSEGATFYLAGLEFLSLTPQGEVLLRRFVEQARRRQLQGRT